MKKISLWAKRNTWKTRVSIVALYALITLLAFFTGRNLLMLGIMISGFLFIVSLIFFILGVLFYPEKKKENKRLCTFNFYARQKICDGVLAFSTFLVVSSIGNASGETLFSNQSGESISPISSIAPVPLLIHSKDDEKPSFKIKTSRAERKAMLKELRKLLKQTFHGPRQKDLNSGARITLAVLSIIGGVVLSALLAGLACNIACSGAETLSIFVAVFGAVAIAALLVFTIRAIYHHYPKVLVPADSQKRSIKTE